MSIINAVHVSDKDSCITITSAAKKGDTIIYHCSDGDKKQVTSNDETPIYHKIAIIPLKQGDYVYKYGGKIGIALCDIKEGDHVHIHNMKPVGFVEEGSL